MLMATMSRHTEQREPSWDEVLRVFSARKTTKPPSDTCPECWASLRLLGGWIQDLEANPPRSAAAAAILCPNTHPEARPLKSTGSRVGTMASQGATLQNYNNELVKCASLCLGGKCR